MQGTQPACDAINNEGRTGCFYCSAVVGDITIFENNMHPDNHFPLATFGATTARGNRRSVQTHYGWCIHRQDDIDPERVGRNTEAFAAGHVNPSAPSRTTRATISSHPPIDMAKLHYDGYMIITDFISMTTTQFACLSRSLHHFPSLFDIEGAGIFNQTFRGLNDGLRRAISLDKWLTATGTQADAPGLIHRLQLALQRIIAALPADYGHEVQPAEIYILRSAAGCLQQAAHTDYNTTHADFGDINTAPLSFFFAISPEAKLILWERPNPRSELQARTIELEQGQAFLLLGSKVHSGAAYDRENFRGFMYIHQRTYVPPIPRRTYLPLAASRRRSQPTSRNPPAPGEQSATTDPASDSDDLSTYGSPQHRSALAGDSSTPNSLRTQ